MDFFSCFRLGWLAGMLVLVGLAAGCSGSRSAEEALPDERFGHRYDSEAPDGRRTIAIAPADSAVDYFYYPAPFDSVNVRPALFEAGIPSEGQQVEVEVLIKGAFPDACMELHAIEQERTGHIINVTLEMRRPQGSICASVRRPYRFYVMLQGRYRLGNYTLKLNGTAIAFQVLPAREQSR